ncbi:MAG: hypothetical protein ABFS30_09130 [Pseudomonadota bacterium]
MAEHSTAGSYTRSFAIDCSRLWDSQIKMAKVSGRSRRAAGCDVLLRAILTTAEE